MEWKSLSSVLLKGVNVILIIPHINDPIGEKMVVVVIIIIIIDNNDDDDNFISHEQIKWVQRATLEYNNIIIVLLKTLMIQRE